MAVVSALDAAVAAQRDTGNERIALAVAIRREVDLQQLRPAHFTPDIHLTAG